MSQSFLNALLGGALIGLAGILLLWTEGRIMGISGIIQGTFDSSTKSKNWRVLFLLGALLGGLLLSPLGFSVMSLPVDRPLALLGLGGLFVGLGTSMGCGCTSGHGVCGVGRFSRRSIIATITFMATSIASVFFLKFFGVGL